MTKQNILNDYEENYITGYVNLFRSFINWEWFSVPNMVTVFIYCLLKANFKDKSWRGNLIKRGSFITSYDTISKDTKLSVQSIRTCLNRLEQTKEITKISTSQFTVLTICNYDSYQSYKVVANKPSTNEQQTNNKPSTTTKKVKKEKNTIPILKEFSEYAINKSLEVGYELDDSLIKLKYESWKENDWSTGGKKSRKIINWKATLLNTLKYLKKEKTSTITDSKFSLNKY